MYMYILLVHTRFCLLVAYNEEREPRTLVPRGGTYRLTHLSTALLPSMRGYCQYCYHYCEYHASLWPATVSVFFFRYALALGISVKTISVHETNLF